MATQPHHQSGGLLRSRTGLALAAFVAIALFFLITEHTAHLFGLLPFALLLLCPLLHVFMHGGHGGHGGGSRDAADDASQPATGGPR
jgi:hypothetical protein